MTRVLPNRMQTIVYNTNEWDSSYGEDFVIGINSATRHLLCNICQGLPRQPIQLTTCGHAFCKPCFQKAFENDHRHGPRNSTSSPRAKCAVCRKQYSENNYAPFANNPLLQFLYNSLQVKCPFYCGLELPPNEMEEHQVYNCPNRPVRCPNYRCQVRTSYKEMQEVHFPSCILYRIHCPTCFLPVLARELEGHSCVQVQHLAINKFVEHFRLSGKRILPLCLPGEPLAPLLIKALPPKRPYQPRSFWWDHIMMSDDDDFMDALPMPMSTAPFTGLFAPANPGLAAQVHRVEQRGGIDMVDVAPPIQTQSTPPTPPIDPVNAATNTTAVFGDPLASSSITATAGSDASRVTGDSSI